MKMNLKALSDTVNQEIKDLKLALAGMSDRMPDPIDAGCVVEQIQSLQNQLSYRFGLYAAIPATLLITLGLNGATSVNLVKKISYMMNRQVNFFRQLINT